MGLPSVGQPTACLLSGQDLTLPTGRGEERRTEQGEGEARVKGDVDTCSKEAKEFCLLLGDISTFCCGKDLPFTALLKHLQSLEI